MTFKVNPLQTLSITGAGDVSSQEHQSLTIYYQPIIGSQAVALYLTLVSLNNFNKVKDDVLRHQHLLQYMNLGINDLNQARHKLEAVNLLATYRDTESHPKIQHQAVLYHIKAPLTTVSFFNNALLRTALFNQLGEQAYNEVIDWNQPQPLNPVKYVQETETFKNVLYNIEINQNLEAASNQFQTEGTANKYPSTLDYSKILSYIMSEGIDHQQLTLKLKDQVYALHEIYHINESDIANLIFQATDQRTGIVNFKDLNSLAKKKYGQQDKRSIVQNQPEVKVETASVNRFPYNYNENDLAKRKQDLIQIFPELSKEDISLVTICEQLPLAAFLNKIKETKNGFATDNEQYYVDDLNKRVPLKPEVINFLVYYLLIIVNKPNLYKGDLQRTANEWMQENLDSVPKAIVYIRQQEKVKAIQNKSSNRPNYKRRRGSQHKEILPAWLKEANKQQKPAAAPDNTVHHESEQSEEELRAWLDQLIEGEEGNE